LAGSASKSAVNQYRFKNVLKRAKRRIAALLGERSVVVEASQRGGIILQRGVIVRFSGGLANQMICYKLGRYLSALKNCPLVIDAHAYEDDDGSSSRNFQLLEYDIKYDMLVSSMAIMTDIKSRNSIAHVTKDSLPLPNPSEDQKASVVDLLRRHPIIYCDFWLAMCLRREMDDFSESSGTLKDLRLAGSGALSEKDIACLDTIRRCANPVAVHVRRGDFATHDGSLLLTSEYYNRSINELELRLEDPVFFVFSDDIEWCRQNLRARCEINFIDWTTERESFKDMHLASSCRHFVLSNESTFSHQIVQLNISRGDRIVITSGPTDLLKNSLSPVRGLD
jgi:hypothetical protein